MELKLAVEGNLSKFLADQERAGAIAVTSAVRRAAAYLKNDMRRQTQAAGLDRNARPGKSVSKTWQDKSFPARGASLGAAALMYSKFPAAMKAFTEGAIIRAKNGAKWLAVPSENVGRLGNKRVKPSQFAGQLDFVPTRNPNVALLIDRTRGGKGVVMFWLYKQVRVSKRLNLRESAEKWAALIPDYAIAEWERQSARRGIV